MRLSTVVSVGEVLSVCRETESCGIVASWTEEGSMGIVRGRDNCVVGGAVNMFDHAERAREWRKQGGVFGGVRGAWGGFFLLSRRWVREEEEEEAVEVEAGDKRGERVG